MKPTALPHTVLTLFADLLQQVETAPVAGSVYRRTLNGEDYIYAKVPIGSGRVDQFIGKSGDREAEERAKSLQVGMELARQRRRFVAILRGQGLAEPPRAMGAILDSVAHAGLFRSGAVLVGTGAYLASEPLVGSLLPSSTLMTSDVDLAASRLTVTADDGEKMEIILRRADPTFEGIPELDTRAPPSRFRSASGFLVDLVTPTRTRDDTNPLPLANLGAGAAPLQHLAWLIDGAVRSVALWGAGVLVNVPQPARFAVHKLILAQRRDASRQAKRQKDLAQARAFIEVLRQQDPFALEDAFADARAQGEQGWSERIDRSLAEIGLKDEFGR
jgi:hypothetical protein